MTQHETRVGHRARLRERFLANSATLTEVELLELLLMYAIPRRDVAPQAQELIQRFGSISGVLSASQGELTRVPGLGENTATLIKVVAQLTDKTPALAGQAPDAAGQPALLEVEPDLGPLFDTGPEPKAHEMRTFANDEIANALIFIPKVVQFQDLEAFKAHLQECLPYNSESTRERRANYILGRFFPENRLDVPLTYYAAHCTSERDLKPAIFYHVMKAEPLATKVAEELVWPALPMGRVDREDMREFILRYLPDIGPSSQKNALRSLFNTYNLLSVGVEDGTLLRLQVHTGTLEGFLYVLAAEFPKPGIYTFEALEQGPMRRWLLWDREWMRRQLYNLRDVGVVSKISEIDAIRQFTLQYDQMAALRHYFEHPQRDNMMLREQAETEETRFLNSDQDGQ